MKLSIHTLDGDVVRLKGLDAEEVDDIVGALPDPMAVLVRDLGPGAGMTYIRVAAIARVDLD